MPCDTALVEQRHAKRPTICESLFSVVLRRRAAIFFTAPFDKRRQYYGPSSLCTLFMVFILLRDGTTTDTTSALCGSHSGYAPI